MPLLLKKREVRLAHGVEGMGPEDRGADESIGFAGGVAADFPRGIARPERRAAGLADLADHSLGLEIIELVFLFEHVKTTYRLYCCR